MHRDKVIPKKNNNAMKSFWKAKQRHEVSPEWIQNTTKSFWNKKYTALKSFWDGYTAP